MSFLFLLDTSLTTIVISGGDIHQEHQEKATQHFFQIFSVLFVKLDEIDKLYNVATLG